MTVSKDGVPREEDRTLIVYAHIIMGDIWSSPRVVAHTSGLVSFFLYFYFYLDGRQTQNSALHCKQAKRKPA